MTKMMISKRGRIVKRINVDDGKSRVNVCTVDEWEAYLAQRRANERKARLKVK